MAMTMSEPHAAMIERDYAPGAPSGARVYGVFRRYRLLGVYTSVGKALAATNHRLTSADRLVTGRRLRAGEAVEVGEHVLRTIIVQ